jgi:hypothetical protein
MRSSEAVVCKVQACLIAEKHAHAVDFEHLDPSIYMHDSIIKCTAQVQSWKIRLLYNLSGGGNPHFGV